MVSLPSNNPEEPPQEDFYPVIKRKPVSGGRYLLKLMNSHTVRTKISEHFHPRNLHLSEIERRDIEFVEKERSIEAPEYIYAYNTDIGSVIKTLCVFEYTTIPPKITKNYHLSSETIYLGIFNQNPSQEIVVNLVQDNSRPPTHLRILLGKVVPGQKKMKFVKLYFSDLGKSSLVFPGGDHLMIIDSETPQNLNLSK